MNKKLMGALLVSMAATAVMAKEAPAKKAAAKPEAKPAVEMACQNNTCKGKAECKGFGSANCAGKNDCKQQGHLNAKDKAECEAKHGMWQAKK